MRLLVSILEDIFGDIRRHNEDKGQISFDCPACSLDKNKPQGDGSGNLEINYEYGVYKCWVCKETNGMYGNIFDLIRKYGTSKDLKEYKLLSPKEFKQKIIKSVQVTLPPEFISFSEENKFKYKYNEALDYLKGRGFTDEQISYYNLGYASSGTFYNRIIFPSYDLEGKLNYFTGRWFPKGKVFLKYINVEADKELIIFNENKVRWDSTIYLVEGPADHVAIPNSIPLLGKYVSDLLFETLMEKSESFIVVVLDGDAKKDIYAIYNKLNTGRLRDKIRICIPNGDLDPSLIYQKWGYVGIINLLKCSYKPKETELICI